MAILSGLGAITDLLHNANDAVNNVAETVAPGSTNGATTTGDLIGDSGVTDDVIHALGSGDLLGGVADTYSDIVGPGGVINNLGDGHGLGVEGLLGSVLGTADGFLGTGEGLLGGVLGGLGDGGLLG